MFHGFAEKRRLYDWQQQSVEDRVLEILRAKKVSEPLIRDFVASLPGLASIIRAEAATYLTGSQATQASGPLPDFAEFAAFQPNAASGKRLCSKWK
jgi:hypothetical protein